MNGTARSTEEDRRVRINPRTGLPCKTPWWKLAYKERNRESERAKGREYGRSHTEEARKSNQNWRQKNKERFRNGQCSYRSAQRDKNPRFVAEERWRAAFYQIVFRLVNGGTKKNAKYQFGGTTQQIRDHIESQFLDGMTWENHGDVWEVDHIKRVRTFDLTDRKQALECFHFSNVRPLWKEENIRQQHRRVA